MPWTSTLFVLGPLAGRLADRTGNRPVLVAGLVLAAAGTAWIALLAGPGLGYGALVVPFLVTSVGGSMAMPAAASAVLGGVSSADMGAASGVTSMMRELGGVLGLAILVAVFSGTGSYASPLAFLDGFRPTLLVCAALVALGAVAGACVGRPAVAPSPRAEGAPEPVSC